MLRGKENVKALFKENKKLCDEIETKVREYYGINKKKGSKESE